MEKITKLIHSLTSREVKAFRKYATISGKKKFELRLKLFDIYLNNPEISDREVVEKLNKRLGPSFDMLKSRLMNDILNTLIICSNSKSFYSSPFSSRFMVYKGIEAACIVGLFA